MRFLFLDWLSLRDPALPIDDTCCMKLRFDWKTTTQHIRNALGDFAIRFDGAASPRLSSSVVSQAIRDAFVADQRRLLSTDPSVSIIRRFLRRNRYCTIGVALSPSGFISVAVETGPGSGRRSRMRDTAECIAALLVRLVGIAAMGRSPDRGLELSDKTFLISPLTIMPVGVEIPTTIIGTTVDQLAEAALTRSNLEVFKVDRETPAGQGLLRSGNAFHVLARRFTVAAEQTVRQIEFATLPPDGGVQTAELARERATDGYNILKEITAWFWGSTALLCGAFLALILMPSIAFVRRPLELNDLNDEAIPWLFALFFGLALIIAYSVMGLERLFDHRPQDERIRLWNPLGSSFWAIFLFCHWLVLPALVLAFLWFAIEVFWYGYSPTAPKFLLTLVNEEEFRLFVQRDTTTFIAVLERFAWVFPALAVGLLKFSHDKLVGIVIGTQEDSRYQLFLEKFDPILAAGENYVRQLTNVLGEGAASKLPDFGMVRNRIASTRARLTKLIENAKTRFNRSAAATVAIVGAIAAIPGLSELRPDVPADPKDRYARAFETGRIAGENEGKPKLLKRCQMAGGDICPPELQASWNFGNMIGTQSVTFREVSQRADRLESSLRSEAFRKAVVDNVAAAVVAAMKTGKKDEETRGQALTDDALLVRAIELGIEGALKPPPPSVKVDAKQIAREILDQFKEDSFPVLHALPPPCRPDSRLVASIYFLRTKTSWNEATCFTTKAGWINHKMKAARAEQKDGNSRLLACDLRKEKELSVVHKDLITTVLDRLKPVSSPKQILVVGYADSTGPVVSNVMVSNRRANNVATFLRQELGDDITVSAIGRSETSLAGDFRRGDLYEAATSRRVDIRLCYPVVEEPRCAGYCGG